MLRRLLLGIAASTTLVLAGTSVAFADSTGTMGQPNQVCQQQPSSPGNAASAPGSAFNTVNGVAGSVYAGTQTQNSTNPNSVAQYDVACFQVSH